MKINRHTGQPWHFLPLILLALIISPAYGQDVSPAFISVSVNPDSGRGIVEDFVFNVRNSFGSDQIELVRIIIGDDKDDSSALFLMYEFEKQKLTIGENGRFGGSRTQGFVYTGETLSNRYVRVALSGIQVEDRGNSYDLTLPLDFNDSVYEGITPSIFGSVQDTQGAQSQYVEIGEYEVLDNEESKHKPRPVLLDPDKPEGRDHNLYFSYEDKDGADDIKEINIYFAPDRRNLYRFLVLTVTPLSGANTASVNLKTPYTSRTSVVGNSVPIGSMLANVDLSEARTSISRDGNTFAIEFDISFKKPMAGEWKIFTEVMDRAGNRSNLKRMGKLNVPLTANAPRPLLQTPLRSRIASNRHAPMDFESYWVDRDGVDDIEQLEFTFGERGLLFRAVVYPQTEMVQFFGPSGRAATGTMGQDRVLIRGMGFLDLEHASIEELSPSLLKVRLPIAIEDETTPRNIKIGLKGTDFSGNSHDGGIFTRLTLWPDRRSARPVSVEPFFDRGDGRRFTFNAKDTDGINGLGIVEIAFVPDDHEGLEPPLPVNYPLIQYSLVERELRIKKIPGSGWHSTSVYSEDMFRAEGIYIDMGSSFIWNDGTSLKMNLEVNFNPARYNQGLYEIWMRTVERDGTHSRWRVLGGYEIQ